MRTFTGVKTAAQPAGFVGQLRDYQCEGLGWMEFLREFGFGGCLADDMGVGKTAQVLARAGSAAHRGPRAVAGGGAEIADVQLARRGGSASRRNCACWSTPAWRATRR